MTTTEKKHHSADPAASSTNPPGGGSGGGDGSGGGKPFEIVSDILDYVALAKEYVLLNPLDKSVAAAQIAQNGQNTIAENVSKQQLYLAVRWYLDINVRVARAHLSDYQNPDPTTYQGNDPTIPFRVDATTGFLKASDTERAVFYAVFGLLLADSRSDPTLGKTREDLNANNGDVLVDADGDDRLTVAAGFKRSLNAALAEYDTRPEMFLAVYRLLKQKTLMGGGSTFRSRQIAEITRALIAEGTSQTDSLFSARFERALATSLSGATTGAGSVIDIDLPDLEEGTESDIIADNVKALSAIYFSAMLEELKYFQVMDKVVEQFMNGSLPVKRGAAGDPLYKFHRDAQNRITEYERRGLYARSFGLAQGSVDESSPNREFNDLWIRFLSAASAKGRELNSTQPMTVSDEQVFKSGRDLAVNLSLHGYGLAHFAAVELQTLIKLIKDTLSAPEILAAYGTRDIWQLVERVSNVYLGGSANGVRQRTMATAGANIMQWIADKSPNLVSTFQVLTLDKVVTSQVERWLAVTGTTDSQIERYAEPVAVQQQRTIPDFALPSGAASDAVRDAMAKVNVNMPNIAMPTTPTGN